MEPEPQGQQLLQLAFEPQPVLIGAAHRAFADQGKAAAGPGCRNSNFLKGVKWSPDGACMLTCSDDSRLRVFDLPQGALEAPALGPADQAGDTLRPALCVAGGEAVYDYAWYPGMRAASPDSCLFASSSRGSPLQLWDAVTGALRATYRAYNAVDEITAALSLAFTPCGARLYGGYRHALRVFDTAQPGRVYQEVPTFQRGREGLPGLVSCLAFNPDRAGMYAAGSYSGVVGVYHEGSHELVLLLHGHTGGLTQLLFSADGNYLYTGARRDGALICWDVRAGGEVYRLARATQGTNQRVAFDIEPYGRHLVTGGEDGRVRAFDLRTGEAAGGWRAAADCANGCALHPSLPLAATASGQRRLEDAGAEEPESSGSDDEQPEASGRGTAPGAWAGLGLDENCLRLWRLEYSEAEGVAAEAPQEEGPPAVGEAAAQGLPAQELPAAQEGLHRQTVEAH